MNNSELAGAARGLQTEIEALPGVRGARVAFDEHDGPSARVLVVPERSSDRTLREIQDIALRRLGRPFSPQQLQILRTGDRPRARRKLSSVATERSDGRFMAKVTLELAGDVLLGQSDAPAGARFEQRSMARAVLDGIHELLDFPADIESVQMLQVGEERLAVVVVSRGQDVLVGSAAVRGDEHEATARATLDALNRFTGLNHSDKSGSINN